MVGVPVQNRERAQELLGGRDRWQNISLGLPHARFDNWALNLLEKSDHSVSQAVERILEARAELEEVANLVPELEGHLVLAIMQEFVKEDPRVQGIVISQEVIKLLAELNALIDIDQYFLPDPTA
jgi:hypothetical protein